MTERLISQKIEKDPFTDPLITLEKVDCPGQLPHIFMVLCWQTNAKDMAGKSTDSTKRIRIFKHSTKASVY